MISSLFNCSDRRAERSFSSFPATAESHLKGGGMAKKSSDKNLTSRERLNFGSLFTQKLRNESLRRVKKCIYLFLVWLVDQYGVQTHKNKNSCFQNV